MFRCQKQQKKKILFQSESCVEMMSFPIVKNTPIRRQWMRSMIFLFVSNDEMKIKENKIYGKN